MVEQVKNLEKLKETFGNVAQEVSKTIVGQQEVIEHILVAILTGSNALLESPPGLGKTTLIKSLAQVLDLDFSRIQNTPDLMPSDITGTYVIEEHEGKKTFIFQKGPLFANIVLADEINRATPKTQAALLEAMQEKQVTVGTETFYLEEPFFVLATQNPIDNEGVYPLPEAQVDRFLLKIVVPYPTAEEELEIVNRFTTAAEITPVNKLLGENSIKLLQKLTRQVPIADDIKQRAVKLVQQTRNTPERIEYGASPRASIGLILAAKAHALIQGRKFVSSKDVDAMALPVLRHRIIASFSAEREGKTTDDLIKELLDKL
ncbi:MAG: AAA family ATPase [Candidatus Woesearchaeota archaeon]